MKYRVLLTFLALSFRFSAASNHSHAEPLNAIQRARQLANARVRELQANKSEEEKEERRRKDRERKASKRANDEKLMASATEVTAYGTTIDSAALKALHDERQHASQVRAIRYEKNRRDPKWLDKSSMQRRIRAAVKANKDNTFTAAQMEQVKAIEIGAVLKKGHLDEPSLREISEKTFKRYGKYVKDNASSSSFSGNTG